MNDEFLYRYRQRPRPEFVESLYGRISAEPRITISFVPLHKLAQNVALMGVALLLMYAYSPGVRGRLLGRIAGMG
jgi:hypothetical protein